MDGDFDLETVLPDHATGLVVLTQNPDLLRTWHLAGITVVAAMPRNPLPPTHRLRRAAKELGAPLVATPGSFFLHPDDATVHRLLRAIDRNTSLSRLAADDVAPPDAWLAPPQEYIRRFAICPTAVDATHEIAERLVFSGPRFGIVMPPLANRNGDDPDRRLRTAAYSGAHRRYGDELSEGVVERLEHELHSIAGMGFSAYFLIVQDIIHHSTARAPAAVVREPHRWWPIAWASPMSAPSNTTCISNAF
jgi:DNA polymerase-3 subunit alpha/error-prone DNA polymerase